MAIDLNDKKEKKKECKYCIDKSLEDAGWKYNKEGIFIPYDVNEEETSDSKNIYLHISRTGNKRKRIELLFTWAEETDDNVFKLERSFLFNNTLDIGDKKVMEELIGQIRSSGEMNKNPGDEERYAAFTEDIIDKIIKSECLEVFKHVEYEEPSPEEETTEENQNKTFKDYDKIIKKEARKIIKDDTLFDKIIDSISLTHEGNDNLKKRLPLIMASVFVGEPVHTEINADSGQGKTDNAVETAKNFPAQYVKTLRNVSPKNIYYDRASYGDYNILIFDDVTLSESLIEVLKELSDNKKPIKELKTVIDGKSRTFTLPGKYLIILTYAKGNYDEELLNRLYKLNIIIDDGDSPKIKGKILDNAVINADNNEIISRNRLIMEAAMQNIIDKEITVFNPFIPLFEPENYSNRDIKVFVNLVSSKTFFHIGKRKAVRINGKTIFIGSFEDYEFVEKIWEKDNDTQKYKLNDKQLRILDILPEKTTTEAYKECKKALDNYEAAETEYEKNKILEEQYTRKRIAKEIGVNENTVRNYIDKSSGTAKTLLDTGLIGRIVFKINENNSPYIYYKIKNDGDDSDSDESDCHDCQIEYDTQLNTLYYKIRIIYDLFRLSNIIINEEGFNYLKIYCKYYPGELHRKDYDSYYKFIDKVVYYFDREKYAIDVSEATLQGINYMVGLEEEINKLKNDEDKSLSNNSIFLDF